jgi:hypothetical protein
MQLPEPNVGPRSDPCAFVGMLLTFFWLSSFSVSRYVVGYSIPATRGSTCAPFVGVYQRVLIGVGCSLRLHRIEVSWRCPVVSSSVVLSVGTVSSPISVLAIDLATTGLKSRNVIAGANVKCVKHQDSDGREARFRLLVLPLEQALPFQVQKRKTLPCVTR